jgi:hypothetical protein
MSTLRGQPKQMDKPTEYQLLNAVLAPAQDHEIAAEIEQRERTIGYRRLDHFS